MISEQIYAKSFTLRENSQKNNKKILVSAKSQKYRPYVSTILSDKHCGHIFKK